MQYLVCIFYAYTHTNYNILISIQSYFNNHNAVVIAGNLEEEWGKKKELKRTRLLHFHCILIWSRGYFVVCTHNVYAWYALQCTHLNPHSFAHSFTCSFKFLMVTIFTQESSSDWPQLNYIYIYKHTHTYTRRRRQWSAKNWLDEIKIYWPFHPQYIYVVISNDFTFICRGSLGKFFDRNWLWIFFLLLRYCTIIEF